MKSNDKVQAGTIWQHNKGGVYQVCTLCTIEETDTPAVMYKSLNVVERDDFWVRPTNNFLDRFTPINLTAVQIAELLKEQYGSSE